MTRKQIENAAVTMKESQNYHMSFEDAQDYINKCGFDIPWNDGDVFVDEREITRTIGNVLKWRINSVWHDVSEKPKFKGKVEKEMFMLFCNSKKYGLMLISQDEWDDFVERGMFHKWAYVDDLLPERKEETK